MNLWSPSKCHPLSNHPGLMHPPHPCRNTKASTTTHLAITPTTTTTTTAMCLNIVIGIQHVTRTLMAMLMQGTWWRRWLWMSRGWKATTATTATTRSFRLRIRAATFHGLCIPGRIPAKACKPLYITNHTANDPSSQFWILEQSVPLPLFLYYSLWKSTFRSRSRSRLLISDHWRPCKTREPYTCTHLESEPKAIFLLTMSSAVNLRICRNVHNPRISFSSDTGASTGAALFGSVC